MPMSQAQPGLLFDLADKWQLDLGQSVMIGDRAVMLKLGNGPAVTAIFLMVMILIGWRSKLSPRIFTQMANK